MKKKILTKHILMALAMAAMVPAGQAWAKDIDSDWNPTVDPTTNTLTITPTETVTSSANYTYGGKPISEYSNIVINYVAKEPGDRPLGVYSERFDWEQANVTVHVTGNYDNNDALHFTNFGPSFIANNLVIQQEAKDSDAINLSRDI